VPSDMDAATLTLDDAVDLLAEKAAKELAKSGSTAAPIPLAQQRGRDARGQARQGARPGAARSPNGPGRPPGSGAGKRGAPQPAAAGRRARPQEAGNKGNRAGNAAGAPKGGTRRSEPARPAQKTTVRRRPA
jgi:hypothetical protein